MAAKNGARRGLLMQAGNSSTHFQEMPSLSCRLLASEFVFINTLRTYTSPAQANLVLPVMSFSALKYVAVYVGLFCFPGTFLEKNTHTRMFKFKLFFADQQSK